VVADAALNRARRRGLAAGAVLLALRVPPAGAQMAPGLAEAIRSATGGAALRPGGLAMEIPELVENGNAVPLRLSLLAAPEHRHDPVVSLLVLSELNPAREVIALRWPRGWPLAPAGGDGAGAVATRIRLATSQSLVALAQTRSGRWWQARADVIVTLAACVEGG
jgi:sulfur-oxidizing protein SoxY